MPEVVVPIHEFFDRHSEIPDTPDCYLVGMWSKDTPEGAENEGFYPTPWAANKIDALTGARDMDREDWDYQWGWDGLPEHAHFRVGCNSPTVHHPVYMRFRWGDDTILTEDGLKMLDCESTDWDLDGRYCKHCHRERSGKPRDCPVRRLRAMAEAVGQGTAGVHVRAVQKWHMPKKGK